MISYDDAFDDLYRQARRVAFRVLRVGPEADDVAQETMIRAYLRWSRIAGHAEAWVSRVSGNLAIDRARALQRRVDRERRVHRMDTVNDAGRVTDGPGAAFDSEVAAALLALPRRQRDVVLLRYVADQSEAAVAAVLGCSPGSVKTHASRGVAALRLSLGEAT
jgi:RNA polymerase sigma factor (sigma-70 family)